MFSFVTTVPQMSSLKSLALLFLVLAVGDSSRVRRSSDDDDLPGDISLGSHQDAQSSQEKMNSKEGASGIQQHHQGQQQLAAKIGDKHYVLQQQTALGQQLAKLGKKTAVQQLADAQKQAVANGDVKKDGQSKANEELRED